MVALPQDRGLTLLPALRDPERVSATQEILLRMIAQKQAILIDWPEVTMHSGGQAKCETILEQRYPIEFDQPQGPQTFSVYQAKNRTPGEKALRLLRLAGIRVPQTYETRNTGVSFEVETIVAQDGHSADFWLTPSYVRLEKMSRFTTMTADLGTPTFVQQPVFQTRKVSVHLTLKNGERRLIYVGKSTEPAGQLEFFILGTTVLPNPLVR